jgi:hypothetical protein
MIRRRALRVTTILYATLLVSISKSPGATVTALTIDEPILATIGTAPPAPLTGALRVGLAAGFVNDAAAGSGLRPIARTATEEYRQRRLRSRWGTDSSVYLRSFVVS